MLTMTQEDDIRKMFFSEGLNISKIADITKHDRKTVREYINKDDWNIEISKANKQCTFPKLEPYKKEIDEWLHDDLKIRAKQRHTAKRVFDRLCEIHKEDFNCSYRTVAGYVSMKKKELFHKHEGFIPLEHFPGEAQVDFGEADFHENGRLYNGSYLNVSFPYSNAGFTQLFKGENLECLLEGLKTIFEHIGGVPFKLWFDNTKIIVTKILMNKDREITADFQRFKQHYGFDMVFCNLNAGHEKGNVESKVGYHRRNFLAPPPSFERLSDFNKELLKMCDDDRKREHYRKNATIEELFNEDLKRLLCLPNNDYEVCKYVTVKTDKCGRFYLNEGLHEYSSAPKYSEAHITVKITAYEVIPLDENNREIVRHSRMYGNYKQQHMEWLPYLTQLARKPGAFKYTGIYRMMPDPLRQYLDECKKSERGSILNAISKLTEIDGFEQAVKTVTEALKYDVHDADSIMAIHNRLTNVLPELKLVRIPKGIPKLKKCINKASDYDSLLIKDGGHKC